MAFTKTATIPLVRLASGSYSDGSLKFSKCASKSASIYRDGGSKISVQAMLDMAAKEYNISSDPADYIFEAARAVTAEVPNQNGDGFPKEELLRFDHRLGKQVYQTFIGKPHHINHRADDPKTSRGIVLDASYNDISEPLPECPNCGNKTASVEGRDRTGVNCKKCGQTVKDEFVELLIAIDTKKDPTFAKGVKNGSLNSLSMGCEAEYTDCSICENRARTVAQFCKHIRSGNKKKIFKTASGPKMAFEKCGGVVFTEISRVDQPADPTALQKEIFSIDRNARPNIFLMAEKLVGTNTIGKSAQVEDGRIDNDKLSQELEEIAETHPELYRQIKELISGPAAEPSDDVSEPKSIGDYEKKIEQAESDKKITQEELGIKPEFDKVSNAAISSKIAGDISRELGILFNRIENEESKVSLPNFKFAESYRDIEVGTTERGNIRAFTPHGTLFVVRTEEKPGDAASARSAAMEVLNAIAEHGLVAAAAKFNATVNPHIAQVLEHHLEDFAGGRDEGDKGPITDGGETDMAESREKPAKDLQSGQDDDHAEKLGNPPKSVTKDHEPDHKEKVESPAKSITDKEINDMDSARATPSKDTLKDIEVDRSDKLPKTSGKTAQAEDPTQHVSEEKCAKCGKSGCGDKCAEDKNAARPPAKTEDGKNPQYMTSLPTVKPDTNEMLDGSALPSVDEESGDMTVDPLDLSPAEAMKLKQILDDLGGLEGLDIIASKNDDKKKYMSRINRLYSARMEKLKAEASAKVASATDSAIAKLESKFIRALKLAAKRQVLNLEVSPIKARMFDVLASKMELDADTYYPGMDDFTASRIIEATAAQSFDEFVDCLVKRAVEFTAMNDEAFKAIEADVKNLRPVPVEVADPVVRTAGNSEVRTAAVNGNLIVAPSANTEVVSSGNKKENIRSALGNTKVQRTSQAWKK